MEKCHCGLPLHYTNKSIERQMMELVAKCGEYVNVISSSTGKRYKVQRHYIALHGIKEHELHTYGFEEVQ